MKTNFTLFVLAMLVSVFSASSQECSDLMISEVVEGWSNNKAIEIYNPTAEAIDASDYGIVRFRNGSSEASNVTYLDGVTIEPFDVFVVVLDKLNPDGTGFDAPIWDELQLQADLYVNPDYNDGTEAMYFNGNDGLAIVLDGGQQLVDLFGRFGEGAEFAGWNGYLDENDEQAYVTEDHTLVRKPDVTMGITENPFSFDVFNEYDSLPANTFENLGFHNCACNANSVLETVKESSIKLFPNPLQEGFVTVTATEVVKSIEVYSVSGSEVESFLVGDLKHAYIDLSSFESGTYLVKAILESGVELNEILIKK